MNRYIALGVLVAAFLALSAQAGADTITVNDASDPAAVGAVVVRPENCLPDSGQPCRLRDAVALARGGDTIVFAPHVTVVHLYHGLDFRDRSGLPVTVDGGGRTTVAMLDNNEGGAAFRTAGPRASNITVLRGLRVLAHTAFSPHGRSLYNCGGAVANLGQLLVIDSSLTGHAFLGGGLCNSGVARVERSMITGQAMWGGAALYNAGVLDVSNSSLLGTFVWGEWGNNVAPETSHASGWGAALYNNYGTARLDFVTFGRGWLEQPGQPLVVPCGAQVYNRSGDVSIDRSIVSVGSVRARFVNPHPIPVYPINQLGVCGYPDMVEAPTRVSRSLIEMSGGSRAWAHPDWVIDGGGNHDVAETLDAAGRRIAIVGPTQDNGGTTPTALPLPAIHAVVIDAVDCDNAPATDQRGVPRPRGGRCDRGAVELE